MSKELPVRKNIRLKEYNYSQNGAYFLTVCVKNGHNILWKQGFNVGANRVRPQLSDLGNVVEDEINKIDAVYKNASVNKFVIMPNHVHMIIFLQNNDCNLDIDNCERTRFAPTISRIIKQTKGLITKRIGYSIWQSSFHDRIIRDEAEYRHIWHYIDNNPLNWSEDVYFT